MASHNARGPFYNNYRRPFFKAVAHFSTSPHEKNWGIFDFPSQFPRELLPTSPDILATQKWRKTFFSGFLEFFSPDIRIILRNSPDNQ